MKAFAWLDVDRALRLTAAAPPGPLHGRWVGIKDVIDTARIPTERGCSLYAGRVPERSAVVVERIEAAGGVVVGKTVTAELASAAPGPTCNPWNPSRTPGGSSMGSAAAVAAGMAPLAVGTQTAGSVIRPAAFCGVVGYKPSIGLVPRDGVMALSQTLDTLGGFAETVAEVADLCSVMAGRDLSPLDATGPPRFLVYRSPHWEQMDPDARANFDATLERLRAEGAVVQEPEAPAGFDSALLNVQRPIQLYETARNMSGEVQRAPDLVSTSFRRSLALGASISAADYHAALAERARLIEALTAWAGEGEVILTPPALGEAPGLETTGDPRLCARWTLIGAPAISLPSGLGATGLPLGLQLCGAPGRDRALLGAAAWVERLLRDERPR